MARGYYALTRITDYGPYITKLILPLPERVKEVPPDSFSVYVERLDDKGDVMLLPKSWMAADDREPSRGYLSVREAYPADPAGNRQDEGEYLVLELEYGPTKPLSALVSAPNGLNVFIHPRHFVTQTKPIQGEETVLTGLSYDFLLENRMPEVAVFRNATSSFREPLNYGYFVPQELSATPRPLLVWLHGAGEGGIDPTVAYAANKVTNLASPKIQKIFGGAYVLAPQTRTFWMNDGTGEYGRTGKSIYGEALKALIDEFVERNPGVDRNRIYIGGDSNGGFMTMRMILDYPDTFAAAFPVCEALYDETITEEQLMGIRDLPIWFTHAKNDPVVKPEDSVLPTYRRLIAAGAKNVHFTFWDCIRDIHEGFRDEKGEPFEYLGHFAWIPMLNDDCRTDFDGKPVTLGGREVSLLEWLACQRKE